MEIFSAIYTHTFSTASFKDTHVIYNILKNVTSVKLYNLYIFPTPHAANSSPKIFAPSAPIRCNALSSLEQHELKGAPWFQAGLPREISLEVLSRQSPGAFLVRQSSTKPGCFALSLRVPPPAPKVAHYLILKTPRGYKIKVSPCKLYNRFFHIFL